MRVIRSSETSVSTYHTKRNNGCETTVQKQRSFKQSNNGINNFDTPGTENNKP